MSTPTYVERRAQRLEQPDGAAVTGCAAVAETVAGPGEFSQTVPSLVVQLTLAGSALVRAGDQTLRVERNSLVVVGAGARLVETVAARTTWRTAYLMIAGPLAVDVARLLPGAGGTIMGQAPPAVRAPLLACISSTLAAQPSWNWAVIGLLADLALHLGGRRDEDERILAAMEAWSDSHLHGTQRLAAMSRDLGMPERTLRWQMQRAAGLPPARWLRRHRCLRAQALLQRGTPVHQVAEASGFTDAATFSRTFRSVMGYPPSQATGIGLRRSLSGR